MHKLAVKPKFVFVTARWLLIIILLVSAYFELIPVQSGSMMNSINQKIFEKKRVFKNSSVTIGHYKSLWRGFKLSHEYCGSDFDCEIVYDVSEGEIREVDVLVIHPVFTKVLVSTKLNKKVQNKMVQINKTTKPLVFCVSTKAPLRK